MKNYLKYCLISFFVFTLFSCEENQKSNPNIIYILADYLGYGEIGAFGQKLIETTNIEALAKEGMIFTDH